MEVRISRIFFIMLLISITVIQCQMCIRDSISDFRNGFIRIGKLFTGGLHTVIIQVIQRCAMSQFAEIAAEIIPDVYKRQS